MIKYGVFE